jgi:hypothetical protein
MAMLPAHRPQPTFQPIVVNEPLTDDEQARLEMVKDVYPHLEWTTTRQQMNRLVLQRWLWRNGDEA